MNDQCGTVPWVQWVKWADNTDSAWLIHTDRRAEQQLRSSFPTDQHLDVFMKVSVNENTWCKSEDTRASTPETVGSSRNKNAVFFLQLKHSICIWIPWYLDTNLGSFQRDPLCVSGSQRETALQGSVTWQNSHSGHSSIYHRELAGQRLFSSWKW